MANNPPAVTILAGSSYAAGTVLTGTQLFSASDPQGSSDIDYIKLFDSGVTGGAVWRYNGSIITPGGGASGGFQFEYANRGLLSYTVGTGSNDFVFEAFDNAGVDSNDALHTITGTSTNNPPVVTILAGSSYTAGTDAADQRHRNGRRQHQLSAEPHSYGCREDLSHTWENWNGSGPVDSSDTDGAKTIAGSSNNPSASTVRTAAQILS